MKRLFSLGTGLFVMVAVPAQASASEAVAQDSSVINLQSVEVTANRASATTPVAFTNLTAREISRENDGRDIPFMLQSTPSVVSTGDAGGGVGYTGLRIRGTDASRINITANGVPINDSESHNVYWVNMPDMASSLRDIQIQRGAGTSTNGAGAFGASVNMITDAPSYDSGAQLTVGYGSYNTNRQTFKASTGLLRDHWSADARISHLGSDGYIDRAFTHLWSYLGQVAYTGGATSVRLLAFGGKERTYMAWDYPTPEQIEKYGRRYNQSGEYVADDGSIAYYPDQCDNFVQHHLQLLFGQSFGDNWSLNVTAHYTKGDGYYEQYKCNRALKEYGLQPFYNADGERVKKSDLVRLKFNDNDFGGVMANANYRKEAVTAVLGAAVNWHRGNHFGQVQWVRNYVGPINPLQEYYRNRGRKFDFNVFGRGDWKFAEGWNAYADLQLRHIKYSIRGISDNFDYATDAPAVLDVLRNYTFFNPKAGVSYLSGNHRAYASWSVAHKEPVRDNFTDADPAHYPVAERLFDYEAGYTFENALLTASAGLYYMDYKNQLVVTGQLSDTGNPLSVNVPKSYRAGIELQWALRPVKWFDWNLNATFSSNRIKNFVEYIYEDEWTNPITVDCGNTRIAFSPDVVLNNSFNFHLAGFDGSVATRYVSAQYMNNAESAEARLKGYCVSDISVGYTFTRIPSVKELRVGATLYNAFNAKYFNNGWAAAGYYMDGGEKVIYRYAAFAPQTPANLLATVTLKF